jgi:FkbM family methyltransferase
MINVIKNRIRNFLRWQVAVGSRSDEVLAAVSAISTYLERSRQLAEYSIEDAIAASGIAQREVAYHRALIETDLKIIATKLVSIEQKIDLLRFVTGAEPKRHPRPPFVYLGDHLGLATVDVGFRIFVDTRDRQITPHLATVGIWEPWNVALLQNILKPGDLVVEVGANFGFFTILMANLVGPSGRIRSFEANPALITLLTDSLQINGISDRVRLNNIAVTDSRGETDFSVYQNFSGDGHLSMLNPGRHPNREQVRVPSDTLDNLISEQLEIRLLRLDAEGSEPAILRGARYLIEKSPRLVILMEWGWGTKHRTDELQYLSSHGFKFYFVSNNGSLLSTTLEKLAETGLCDILCYRGDVSEFISCSA